MEKLTGRPTLLLKCIVIQCICIVGKCICIVIVKCMLVKMYDVILPNKKEQFLYCLKFLLWNEKEDYEKFGKRHFWMIFNFVHNAWPRVENNPIITARWRCGDAAKVIWKSKVEGPIFASQFWRPTEEDRHCQHFCFHYCCCSRQHHILFNPASEISPLSVCLSAVYLSGYIEGPPCG